MGLPSPLRDPSSTVVEPAYNGTPFTMEEELKSHILGCNRQMAALITVDQFVRL